MSLVEFKSVLKFIRGGKPSPEEQKELYKEAALMTLARATSVDAHIKKVEVEVVQRILAEATGEEISGADIRTAAKSEIFLRKPLEKYLADFGRKLDVEGRMSIMHYLAEVLESDEQITDSETAYFDMVAKALKATPSEIMGLGWDKS
jgi:uncharacterized tellurite resistance protein B-like protein